MDGHPGGWVSARRRAEAPALMARQPDYATRAGGRSLPAPLSKTRTQIDNNRIK